MRLLETWLQPSSNQLLLHAGRIRVQQPDGSWADGSQTTLSGLPISGNPKEILLGNFEIDARQAAIMRLLCPLIETEDAQEPIQCAGAW